MKKLRGTWSKNLTLTSLFLSSKKYFLKKSILNVLIEVGCWPIYNGNEKSTRRSL